MSDSASKAVFLSYASQDAAAAKRICDALRAAGVEVWFDQSELVGGDAWDQKIRKQIKDCALLIPIISSATQARTEGYFRLEWRLADQRTHLMAKGRPFLLPVVIDDTRDAEAQVPDSFTEVQWTRLPGGGGAERFSERVKHLLAGGGTHHREPTTGHPHAAAPEPVPPRKAGKRWMAPVIAGTVVALLAVAISRPWEKKSSLPEGATPIGAVPSVAAPPAASAVQNLSEARQLVERAWQLTEVNKGSNPDGLRAAADLAEKATLLESTDVDVWATAGLVDIRCWVHGADRTEKREEMARTKIMRAKGLDPRSIRVRMAEAKMLTELDLYPDDSSKAKAEAILRELLQAHLAGWERTEVLGVLGLAISKQGRQTEAVKFLEQAGQTDSGWMGAASWEYLLLKMFPEALAAARRQTEMDREAGLSRNVGQLQQVLVQIAREDLDAALTTLNQLPDSSRSEEGPASARALIAFYRRDSAALLSSGRLIPGEFVENSFLLLPKPAINGCADLFAGRLGAARVEFDVALAMVDRRLSADRTSFSLLSLKIELLCQLGRADEADQTYRTLQQLHGGPGYPAESYDLANLGRKEEALTRLETELRNQPLLFGHLAARLDPAYDLLRGDPRFEKLLRDTLPPGAKPFDDPKSQTQDPGPLSPPPVDSKSVAVLAFANLSDDKANEYFSDGISEELLNVLAKVPGLKVTARTSSFHFKGTNTAIPEIAQQLGVAYVVEGSVRKSGDKVRITAQLIKAADDFHVWSDTFTRDLKDVFAVQDEIAGLIARQLSLKLGTVSASAAVDPEAYELYLQAREAWNRRDSAGLARAEELLDRALVIAPDFARAHAARADVWSMQGQNQGGLGGFVQRNSARVQKIFGEIQAALALEPESAEVHASLGNAWLLTWHQTDAIREFRRAIELNPNYATAHQWLGRALWIDGWIDEAGVELRRAAELDPLSHRILDNNAAYEYAIGHYAAALALNERALALHPDALQAATFRIRDLSALGRHDEAVAEVRRSGIDRQKGYALFALEAFVQAGMRPEAEEIFTRLSAGDGLYWANLMLGRREQALVALDAEDLDLGDGSEILMSPLFDSIRDEPRFRKKLALFGMTEAHARAQVWHKAHPLEKPEAKP